MYGLCIPRRKSGDLIQSAGARQGSFAGSRHADCARSEIQSHMEHVMSDGLLKALASFPTED
jgi:hypothetical protein